jgi:transposase
MTIYAGLDVSDKTTHICVMDGTGAIKWRGVCASDPDVVARMPRRDVRGLERVVLETGPLSSFLYHGLIEGEVPVLFICARHSKGVLLARISAVLSR